MLVLVGLPTLFPTLDACSNIRRANVPSGLPSELSDPDSRAAIVTPISNAAVLSR